MTTPVGTDGTINKTLDLTDVEKTEYRAVCDKIEKVIADLDSRGLKYTTYQAEFSTGWGEGNIWFKRKLWEMSHIAVNSGVRKGHRVLDCGGASSIFSFFLASNGCFVETVDIDWRGHGIVENANKVAREMGWKMHNLAGDMTKLAYKDETFDRIFTICVLEHLDNDSQIKAVKEMARVLKPGGIMGLTFDYGPSAPGSRYAGVGEINERIVKPSGLSVMGNPEYEENEWFHEQYCTSWGALFLEKHDTASVNDTQSSLLCCPKPQDRSRIRVFLSRAGLRKGNVQARFNRFLSLVLSGEFGHILEALTNAFKKSGRSRKL